MPRARRGVHVPSQASPEPQPQLSCMGYIHGSGIHGSCLSSAAEAAARPAPAPDGLVLTSPPCHYLPASAAFFFLELRAPAMRLRRLGVAAGGVVGAGSGSGPAPPRRPAPPPRPRYPPPRASRRRRAPRPRPRAHDRGHAGRPLAAPPGTLRWRRSRQSAPRPRGSRAGTRAARRQVVREIGRGDLI